MFSSINSVYTIVWAIVIGIAFAVIYTNIQRTAISKLITHLIDNDITSCEKAVTLDDIKILGISAIFLKNAVKKQNGLKKIILSEKVEECNKEEAEILLYGNKVKYKYYMSSDTDAEETRKKYEYVPLGILKLTALLILIVITAFVATKAVDIFDGYLSSKSESKVEEEQAQSEHENGTSQQNQTDETESNTNVDTEISKENDKINESPDINTTDDDDTLPSRPSIPMGPTIK